MGEDKEGSEVKATGVKIWAVLIGAVVGLLVAPWAALGMHHYVRWVTQFL